MGRSLERAPYKIKKSELCFPSLFTPSCPPNLIPIPPLHGGRFSRSRPPAMPGGGCSPSLSSSGSPQRAHGWLRRLGLRRDPAPAAAGRRRMLVTVTVVGSAGPIRFVAGEEDPVAAVIGTALRCYAREGRSPALGRDVGEFHLFCARSDYMEPLDHAEAIGGAHGGGARDFTLCKKKMPQRASFQIDASGGAGGSKRPTKACGMKRVPPPFVGVPPAAVLP